MRYYYCLNNDTMQRLWRWSWLLLFWLLSYLLFPAIVPHIQDLRRGSCPYCRLSKTQEKILVCHNAAVAEGGLSKRVIPRTKAVIFSSWQKGCRCLNGYKWGSCTSSENTERRIGSTSPLSDLLGGIFPTRLLFVAALPFCLVSSVYLTHH